MTSPNLAFCFDFMIVRVFADAVLTVQFGTDALKPLESMEPVRSCYVRLYPQAWSEGVPVSQVCMCGVLSAVKCAGRQLVAGWNRNEFC